jgi:hypothetical protein
LTEQARGPEAKPTGAPSRGHDHPRHAFFTSRGMGPSRTVRLPR